MKAVKTLLSKRVLRTMGVARFSEGAVQKSSSECFSPKFPYARTRPVMPWHVVNRPRVINDVFVHPSAQVIGSVTLCDGSSVGMHSVVRGDLNSVKIGGYSHLKDHVVITTEKETNGAVRTNAVVGNYSVVESGSVLHSCEVGHESLIGERSTLSEGSKVGSGCVLLPRSYVPPGGHIPDQQCWGGSPAKFIRDVPDEERQRTVRLAQSHHELCMLERSQWLPEGSAYLDAQKNPPVAK